MLVVLSDKGGVPLLLSSPQAQLTVRLVQLLVFSKLVELGSWFTQNVHLYSLLNSIIYIYFSCVNV